MPGDPFSLETVDVTDHPFTEGTVVLVRTGAHWSEHTVTRLYKTGRFLLNGRFGSTQWRAQKQSGGDWHAEPTKTYSAVVYLDTPVNRETMAREMHREDIKKRGYRAARVIDFNRHTLPEQLVLDLEAAIAKHPTLKEPR
jgi:hypothetical protein